VQVSHLKLAMLGLHGAADSVRRTLDRARAEGVEISADVYPYPFWQSTLTVLFPDRDFGNLREAERILREVVAAEGLRIGDYAPNAAYRGRTVAEIAQRRGESPAATLVALIRDARALPEGTRAVENGVVSAGVESVIATAMDEGDVSRLLAWEHTNICSDGMLAGVHPRGYGAFPRVLGRYVREQGQLSLEEAIRKMTSLPARHVGLTGRGTLVVGGRADLVLLDPATVLDRSTPDAPHALATGIDGVWVNGVRVWQDGAPTGSRPGEVLRRRGGEKPYRAGDSAMR
jgi:N-acyl-D-amino-acid deacylase